VSVRLPLGEGAVATPPDRSEHAERSERVVDVAAPSTWPFSSARERERLRHIRMEDLRLDLQRDVAIEPAYYSLSAATS